MPEEFAYDLGSLLWLFTCEWCVLEPTHIWAERCMNVTTKQPSESLCQSLPIMEVRTKGHLHIGEWRGHKGFTSL